MPDTVSTTVSSNTGIRYEAVFTNISDGTGESAVRKIRLDTLLMVGTDAHPRAIDIESIDAHVGGFDSVTIYWDRAPATKIAVCPPGRTVLKFHRYLPDPHKGQQGTTGDVLFTTNGTATSQDSYTIRIRGRLRS